MEDLDLMKTLEATDYLDKHTPDVILLKQRLILLVITNLLKQIPIIHILHYNTNKHESIR